jgi:hypothetical protein
MHVRCAYLIGRILPEGDERFRRHVEDAVLPLMRKLPGNRAARALWPREHEAGAPATCLVLEHVYDSAAALAAALASPDRQIMRNSLAEVLSLFEGAVVHVNYDIAESD